MEIYSYEYMYEYIILMSISQMSPLHVAIFPFILMPPLQILMRFLFCQHFSIFRIPLQIFG